MGPRPPQCFRGSVLCGVAGDLAEERVQPTTAGPEKSEDALGVEILDGKPIGEEHRKSDGHRIYAETFQLELLL